MLVKSMPSGVVQHGAPSCFLEPGMGCQETTRGPLCGDEEMNQPKGGGFFSFLKTMECGDAWRVGKTPL